MKDPAEPYRDDEDDITSFEVAIMNKYNSALVTDCIVKSGEIFFGNMFVIKDDAHQFIKETWSEKTLTKKGKFQPTFYGPKFDFLSEPI